ncbi:NADH:quinone reductase [Candidatus Hydrogenisulfobacillus filiaventi]|uniref:Probable nitronate monooxygenase n=1 Tax=Candidatus Hydrogenisulfobacillus filiaventi TaxID=2707344 RepID=A0A6F8ZEC2_9FIRM|nr:NADH:quinone reductase [Candidatus Hydrogenisulfobacillus filiaventi]
MLTTRLTAVLGIDRPVLQGGLAYLARAPLAAAVSEAGGLGQITATALVDEQDSPATLAAEIAAVRRRTARPFGVNFALGHRPIDGLLEVAVAERVPVITLTGGNPAPYVDRIKAAGIRLLTLAASLHQARKAESLGADAVVVVGFEGGGHLGRDDVSTLVLVRRVAASVRIPVVASGGFADGFGLVAALALGAEGVEMGTRFVATVESPAHPAYKQALVEAAETGTVIVERSLGRPGRALDTPWARRVLAAEAEAAGAEALWPLLAGAINRRAALEGDLAHGLAWAGQAAGLITDVPPVAVLLERMEAEARQALERLAAAAGRAW